MKKNEVIITAADLADTIMHLQDYIEEHDFEEDEMPDLLALVERLHVVIRDYGDRE